jgi:hypothetical protein
MRLQVTTDSEAQIAPPPSAEQRAPTQKDPTQKAHYGNGGTDLADVNARFVRLESQMTLLMETMNRLLARSDDLGRLARKNAHSELAEPKGD